MRNAFFRSRDALVGGAYRGLLKPAFFRNDPEAVHDKITEVGQMLGTSSCSRANLRILFGYSHKSLEQNVGGIDFKNPIGLSAGFDKNALLTDVLPHIGFGFAEVGSITGKPCVGNSKPRLWRLPKSKSLVVNYGLKNDGCEAIASRLEGKQFEIPIGMSVAMTNIPENAEVRAAIEDYAHAFRTMEKHGSYVTINISCPNTLGGQPFLKPHALDYLLDVLDEIVTTKLVFVKLSPDLSEHELENILTVLERHRVHGIICTNLTKKRDNPRIIDEDVPVKGGLSGKVVEGLSNDMLAYIYKKSGKRFILIGCGGVFTAEDAYKKIRFGASLVQLITGMIFEGPQVISEINRGLVKLLKRDGFKNISEAVGADNRY